VKDFNPPILPHGRRSKQPCWIHQDSILCTSQLALGLLAVSARCECAWDSRERHDDEEGPVDALVLHEVRDEGDGLDGLAQAHLIGQDAVQVVVVQRHQPLQTLDLSRRNTDTRAAGSVAHEACVSLDTRSTIP